MVAAACRRARTALRYQRCAELRPSVSRSFSARLPGLTMRRHRRLRHGEPRHDLGRSRFGLLAQSARRADDRARLGKRRQRSLDRRVRIAEQPRARRLRCEHRIGGRPRDTARGPVAARSARHGRIHDDARRWHRGAALRRSAPSRSAATFRPHRSRAPRSHPASGRRKASFASGAPSSVRSEPDLPFTEFALAARADWDPLVDDPALRCEPPGMPAMMFSPYPIQFVDRGDTILLQLEGMGRPADDSHAGGHGCRRGAREPLRPFGRPLGGRCARRPHDRRQRAVLRRSRHAVQRGRGHRGAIRAQRTINGR